MSDIKEEVLIIDSEFQPILNDTESEELKKMMEEFVKSYTLHKDKMSIEEWLALEFHQKLPEMEETEVAAMSEDIVSGLKRNEEKKKELEAAISSGRSKESWLSEELKKATENMRLSDQMKYIRGLDEAVSQANESLYRTITTNAGNINMNPCLDGFIAEQYHVQTFNMNAEAAGSPYRAKVLVPEGKAYKRDSVDIQIYDGNGTLVKKYQCKYYKDAKATWEAFLKGDYRGQRKLVPDGQEMDIPGATNVIEIDGISSNPLSKESAKELQKKAQSGQSIDADWNEFQMKWITEGIGKQVGYAALQGAVIGAGFDIAQKVWNGEEIDGEEVVKEALETGADMGVKAAITGAIKVCAEKGCVKAIPKGTPIEIIINTVHIAVENVKVIRKVINGKCTFEEGMEEIQRTTISTLGGLLAGAKGMEIGAVAGWLLFGPMGAAVGGFIGGSVGYMAGSKAGETIVKKAQEFRKKIREKATDRVQRAVEKGEDLKNAVRNAILRFCPVGI